MNRFKLVFFCLTSSFIFLVARFFSIQIIRAKNLLSQNFISFDKELSQRGEIYDSQGNPLVINRQTYDVYVDTQKARANPQLKAALQKELALKPASLSAVLKRRNWQKVTDNASMDAKKALSKYYPEYLNFEEEWVRYYAEGSSSAYLLGFLGKNDFGQPQGYVGAEGYFNQELQGLPVVNEKESDLLGIPFVGGLFSSNKQISGLDVTLTIDKNVQQIVEKELKRGMKSYKPLVGCAVVMEPYSGQVVALSCYPGFDPRAYYKARVEDFTNPLIAKVYEPGSTFKPLIVAIGLENKRFKPETIVPEAGPYQEGEYQIRTWDNKYRGKISVGETLEKSSNVGMVELIKRIPQKTVDQYFDKLGLREVTGLELEGEVNSLIKVRRDWYPIDFLTYSFGQGLAITPVQLLRAFTAIANDGYLVQPTMVKEYYDSNTGEVIKKGQAPKRRVFSEKTTTAMKKLLRNAVDHSEAQWPNKPKGQAICGKTGTAQIPVGGVYDPSKTVASFIGFLPCNKPKYIALVVYREPKSSPWGSETAAPTFFNIANDLVFYYNILPQVH